MATPAGQKTVFRFGLFEADPESGELLKQGEHLRLQDQPFRMLILLLQRPGEVISREELREKLWRENTFVEFDNGLNVAVKKIRDALGDRAENPRFVETIPRRGYRFIAPVSIKVKEGAQPSRPPSALEDSKSEHQAQAPARHKWRYSGWAAGLVVIAVASAMIFSRINLHRVNSERPARTAAAATVTPRRIVAVLEFQNVSRHSAD